MKRISNQILSFRLGFTNNFLVKLQKGYLLVDTSYSNRYTQFLKELKKAKIDLTEISYLVLTHHHDDHAGFARKILFNSPARLIVHKNALRFLRLGIHDQRGEHWNWLIDQLLSPFSKVRTHNYPSLNTRKDDIILQDDEPKILPDLGLGGKIISTPGHSSDSISIVFADGNAIVGDAAMNLLNLGETKYRPFFIQDLDDVFRSWKKLIRFGAKTIFPSHGKPFSVEKLGKNLSFTRDKPVMEVQIIQKN